MKVDFPEIDSCVVFGQPRSGNHAVCKVFGILGLLAAGFPQEFTPEAVALKIEGLPLKGFFISGAHDNCTKLVRETFIFSGIKGVFISRDLRDTATSLAFFRKKTDMHNTTIDSLLDMSIRLVIKWHKEIIAWREVDNIYSITYERLFKDTFVEIYNIVEHLGLSISPHNVLNIFVKQFQQHSPITEDPAFFRQGKVGDWKNHFTQYHKDVFKQLGGQILIDEGYEENLK